MNPFMFALGGAIIGCLWGFLFWSVTFGLGLDWGRKIKAGVWSEYALSLNASMFAGACVFGVLSLVLFRGGGNWALSMDLRRYWLPITFAFGMSGLLVRFSFKLTTMPIWVLVALSIAAFITALAPVQQRFEALTRAIERWGLYVLGGIAASVYLVFSLTRHGNFGSGSWDLGCYNHNIWLIAHGKPLISTVLGEVNFLGDHFVPILFLFAPLAWTGWSGALLCLQALAIAAAVWPIRQMAQVRGFGPWTQLGIGFAYLFSIGTQSMVNFDFHEIVLVPVCLLLALWALENHRKRLFLMAALCVFLSKESAILYAGALGLYAFVFHPEHRHLGLAVALGSAGGFLFVVGWFQPTLLEGGPQGMIHLARFSAFGDSMSEALLNMAMQPGKVLAHFFYPEKKLSSLLITVGGFAFLPLLAPEVWLIILPNLMVRFLADKQEMWGLGFHYSVVLVSLCAYGTVVGLYRVNKLIVWVSRSLRTRQLFFSSGKRDLFWGAAIILSTVGTFWLSPTQPEFASLHKSYFSKPKQVEMNHRALNVIPDDAKVVAQNHFLPFLAYRQYIWRTDSKFFKKADVAILNPTESPWPHRKSHIIKWIRKLRSDAEWTPIFSEGTTVVFQRNGSPAVKLSPELKKAIR